MKRLRNMFKNKKETKETNILGEENKEEDEELNAKALPFDEDEGTPIPISEERDEVMAEGCYKRFTPEQSMSWRDGNEGMSEIWFTTGPIEDPLFGIRFVFNWKDQGWGNQKGGLRVVLVRDGQEIACDDFTGIAGHDWQKKDIKIGFDSEKISDVVALSQAGDQLRIRRNVGGGGGHSLHVNDFKLYYELSSGFILK